MWVVENCHFLYLRPVAYITACTTVQAVIIIICEFRRRTMSTRRLNLKHILKYLTITIETHCEDHYRRVNLQMEQCTQLECTQ